MGGLTSAPPWRDVWRGLPRERPISDRRTIVAWFAAEILPHEPDVRGWLRRSSLRVVNEDDIVQEAYCRMAGADIAAVLNGRAYFFTVVRNIVLEQMRRDRIVRIDAVAEIDALNIVDNEPSPEQAVSSRQELARVQRLIDGLPEKCRTIFRMRKVEALPQREISRRLGVSENVVEKEAAKGLRLILKALSEDGAAAPMSLFRSRRPKHETRGKQRRN